MPKLPFLPREERFYELFEAAAQNLLVAAEKLADLMEHFENVPMKVGHIRDLEHEGDKITHEIFNRLQRTFVTPLDREDIAALAHATDEVLDMIDGAATALRIYGIQAPTERARGLADIIRLQAVEVEKAVSRLRSHRQLGSVLTQCVEINRLENEADTLFLQGMAELFQDEANVAEIIKWREIYDQLEAATDYCEDIANVLEGIVLKYA